MRQRQTRDGRSASTVPGRVSLRINKELREQISNEMQLLGVRATVSAVLRTALELGFHRTAELDDAYKRAVFKEGIIAGLAAFKASVASIGGTEQQIKQEALGAIDGALAGWKK